jgi:hypothetical protein
MLYNTACIRRHCILANDVKMASLYTNEALSKFHFAGFH